jgi:ribosomal protein S8E
MFTNDNEFIYRKIDEAEVTRAETEKIIRLKQLEVEEQRRNNRLRIKKTKTKVAIIAAVIGVSALIIAAVFNKLGLADIGGDFVGIGMISIGVAYFTRLSISVDNDKYKL